MYFLCVVAFCAAAWWFPWTTHYITSHTYSSLTLSSLIRLLFKSNKGPVSEKAASSFISLRPVCWHSGRFRHRGLQNKNTLLSKKSSTWSNFWGNAVSSLIVIPALTSKRLWPLSRFQLPTVRIKISSLWHLHLLVHSHTHLCFHQCIEGCTYNEGTKPIKSINLSCII